MLDERGRRRFGAAEALTAGRGGIAAVSRATGLARSTIGRALSELRGGQAVDAERVRRAGGGRKPMSETDASLIDDFGQKQSKPLKWAASQEAVTLPWLSAHSIRTRIGGDTYMVVREPRLSRINSISRSDVQPKKFLAKTRLVIDTTPP